MNGENKGNTGYGIRIIDIAKLIVSAFLAVGIKLIFHACTPMTEEGTEMASSHASYMSCHWAEQAVFGIALTMTVIALLVLFLPRHGMKAGLSLSMVPLSLLLMLTPGYLIDLCMMETMRCRTVMRPAIMVCATILIALSAASWVIHNRHCGAHHAHDQSAPS